MKILMLNYGFPPLGGDSGEASLNLLKEYAKMPEMEVDFVCASVDEKYHMLKLGDSVTIHCIPIGKNAGNLNFQSDEELKTFAWRAFWFCRGLAKKTSYDLTHSFFAVPCGFISFLLKWSFKIPYVITLRGSDVPGFNHRFDHWHKKNAKRYWKILQKSSFITACNQNLKNLILTSGFKKEIEVVYDGVDSEIFLPDYSKRNSELFTLLCVSRLTPEHGVRVLIQAFKILSGRYAQLRLNIVGDGNERQSLEDLTQGLDISDKISFASQLTPEELVEQYQKADAFVLPTFLDEINKVLLEALACGLPVIATEIFSNKEILSENVNALIAKVKDPDDLAEKIERLILDQNFCRMLEKNARQRAIQFDWKMIASDYFDLYVKTKNIENIRN